MSTSFFTNLISVYSNSRGLPFFPERFTYTPHPIWYTTLETCEGYVAGDDPVSGEPILESIADALTRPLTADEARTGEIWEREATPRWMEPDTEDNLQRTFLENGWTDYMPIILPTEERVAEMLTGTSHAPDEVVGKMTSAYESWSFTVEKVAVNAVMAGAKPEYLPVILALASSGSTGLATSTQSFARMVCVNGPIAEEIGMNSGLGALGPNNQANASIGKAYTLISRNLGGGGQAGSTYWGSIGNTINYNHMTFAENEDALLEGWDPFHVQKGFDASESVVSIFHGYGFVPNQSTQGTIRAEALTEAAKEFIPSGGYKMGATFLLDPTVVDEIYDVEGFTTKEALMQYIYENATITLGEYWEYSLMWSFSRPRGQKGEEPYASWLDQPPETVVTMYRNPEEISLLVVGGGASNFWQGCVFRWMRSVSIDDWR